jgi:hypothetical protein
MAIKAGAILHDLNGFVIDRIQTAGVGNVNIPEEKVYELGNWQTVATVRDIPDLSFDLESFDMSCEIEAVLTGQDPTSIVEGQEFDLFQSKPINVLSPFKSGTDAYDIVRGIAIPYLNLERATYRFGLRQNATQQFTLRGDSIYYIPGTPYYQEYTNVGAGVYNFDHTALLYQEAGDNVYALSVTAKDSITGAYVRLFLGDDYTNTSAGFTTLAALSDYDTLCVVYGSATSDTYPQSVHETASVKPAAIRGKDIDVYVGTSDATPVFSRWNSVQSFEVTRTVNIENDEEFGNYHYVDSGYDTADVTGTIGIKPRTPQELWTRISEIANVPSNEIVGPYTTDLLPVEVRISDPDTGDVLKTLYVPDARFTLPGVQGRVQTKTEVSFAFTSDGGQLLIYAGER